MRTLAAALLVTLGAALSFGADPDRALRLKQTLMAPCCWAEPVAAHNSPLAAEMRSEIDSMVAAGISDSEIMDRFKARYGRRILAEPDGTAGFWLTLMPAVLTVLGALWVVFLLRRWTRRAPAPPATQDATTS